MSVVCESIDLEFPYAIDECEGWRASEWMCRWHNPGEIGTFLHNTLLDSMHSFISGHDEECSIVCLRSLCRSRSIKQICLSNTFHIKSTHHLDFLEFSYKCKKEIEKSAWLSDLLCSASRDVTRKIVDVPWPLQFRLTKAETESRILDCLTYDVVQVWSYQEKLSVGYISHLVDQIFQQFSVAQRAGHKFRPATLSLQDYLNSLEYLMLVQVC